MARDEDDFRIRPGKVRDRGGGRSTARRIGGVRRRPASFVGEVHRAVRRAGGNPNRDPRTGKGDGRFNARGRGAATALTLKGRSAWSRDGSGTRTRRVAVKARVVKLNPQRGAARGRQFVSAKAVDAHLRHLEGDGVTKDGEKGQVYSAERDVEDGRAFLDRSRHDRHQFRFIVSAEDGVELSDLRTTTRDLMKQMEADLGTKLDWIAVDHHNTGHPHTCCGPARDPGDYQEASGRRRRHADGHGAGRSAFEPGTCRPQRGGGRSGHQQGNLHAGHWRSSVSIDSSRAGRSPVAEYACRGNGNR
jgi:hypothetical protein